MYPVSGTPRTFKFSARDMNGFRGGVSVVNWGCKISGFGGEGGGRAIENGFVSQLPLSDS